MPNRIWPYKDAAGELAEVPHLEQACELLWQNSHPRIAEALESEVKALAEKARRLEAVLYPRVVEGGDDAAHPAIP